MLTRPRPPAPSPHPAPRFSSLAAGARSAPRTDLLRSHQALWADLLRPMPRFDPKN